MSGKDVRLLIDSGYRNYPSYYLYSRLRGRIERGIDFIRSVNTETSKEYIDKEHQWVYLNMNKKLREQLWPFFFYREIRKISEWLRVGELSHEFSRLELCLLSGNIKNIFLQTTDTTARLRRLEHILTGFSKGFKGIKEAFDKDGFRGFEEHIMNSFLSIMVVSYIYPVLRNLFRYLIDLRNVMSIYKHIRWGIDKMPPFISGGKIGLEDLRKAALSGDSSQVLQFTSNRLKTVVSKPTELETAFYIKVRNELRRDYLSTPLEPVVIIYYLWNLYLESILISS